MVEYIIDTNVFIRYITGDDKAKFEKTVLFFSKMDSGEFVGTTSDTVICEIVYVLNSKNLYNQSREKIWNSLSAIILHANFNLSSKEDWIIAFDYFISTKLDLVDCFLVAKAKGNDSQIASFDKGIDTITTRRFDFDV